MRTCHIVLLTESYLCSDCDKWEGSSADGQMDTLPVGTWEKQTELCWFL